MEDYKAVVTAAMALILRLQRIIAVRVLLEASERNQWLLYCLRVNLQRIYLLVVLLTIPVPPRVI